MTLAYPPSSGPSQSGTNPRPRSPESTGYVFANAAVETHARFRALQRTYDGATLFNLETIGISPGARCWEIGCGGGSIASWLAGATGPTGYVLATDLDPSRFTPSEAWIRVTRHDVLDDPPPPGPFDLVHARLVLLHLSDRQRALATIWASLKPGGWALIEDFDCSYLPVLAGLGAADEAVFRRVTQGIHALIDSRGGDSEFGRHALSTMRSAGFTELSDLCYSETWSGRSSGALLHIANALQIKDELIAHGHTSGEDIERFTLMLSTRESVWNSYLLHSVRGQRPPT